MLFAFGSIAINAGLKNSNEHASECVGTGMYMPRCRGCRFFVLLGVGIEYKPERWRLEVNRGVGDEIVMICV